MDRRLYLAPIVWAVLACGGDSGPTHALIPTGNPTIPSVSADTNVAALGFVAHTIVEAGVAHGYKVFVPANYNASTAKIPVVVFLHGSGDSGTDNEKQTTYGVGPVVKSQLSTFPAIVVFPQAPSGDQTALFRRLVPKIVDQVEKHYGKMDPKRIYLTGWSYGGLRSFEIAYENPARFAAVAPVSGFVCANCLNLASTKTSVQATQTVATTLKDVPMWQFQGGKDANVFPTDVLPQSEIFKSVNAKYQLMYYPTAGHDITDSVYKWPEFWTWLYAQSR